MDLPPPDAIASVPVQTASVLATPDEPRITETDGLALSAGVGTQYVAVGVQAAYYFQIPHSLYRLAPYIAAGVGPCGPDDGVECTVAGGVLGSWGHKHRVFVDLAYVPLNRYHFSFHGEEPHRFVVSGPALSIGYEYMSFRGFHLRTGIGVGYLLGHPLIPADQRPALALTLIGMGYKLW